MTHFNGIDNGCFNLSPCRQTIAWVSTRRKPEVEHIFFISFSDRQVKAKCQEKLNRAKINRLLQGVSFRTHTHAHTTHAHTHTHTLDTYTHKRNYGQLL